MRSWIFLILISLISFDATGQSDGRRPRIVDQEYLATNEDQPITILLIHLEVEADNDWFYPWGFTLKLHPGSNYSFEGDVVTPSPDFYGELEVEVTVSDGQEESRKFELEIEVISVNDKPIITGHSSLSTDENQSITVQLDHFTVSDPDDKYPNDFSLNLLPGDNYTIDGSRVIPQPNFAGSLSVNLTVSDGNENSDPYKLPIQVNALNRVPEIVNQIPLLVNEDESITILLSHLTVVDLDNSYPEGFTLAISPGENYTISNAIVTPVPNFSGRLTVPLTVYDGKNTSQPFNLSIAVTPANDIPQITNLETEPVLYGLGSVSTPVTQTIIISDVDGDSIMFAEVGLRAEGYNSNSDRLVYTAQNNSKIRGVFDPKTGILTLLGQASPASYTRALKSISFNTVTAQSPDNKKIYIVVNDGKSNSEAHERSLLRGEKTVSLEIPTGFTPNGDLANDTWKIISLKSADEYSNARIKVYNKAGSVVYESIGFEKEWDGRMNGELLPADTYFYTIDLHLETPQGYLKGLVTILR